MERQRSDLIYRLFVPLYAAALMAELFERWKDPWAALLGGGLLALLALRPGRGPLFLTTVLLATVYVLVLRLPAVANHVNLLIFVNLVLLGGALHWWTTSRRDLDFPAYFPRLLPPLRLLLIITYLAAGFHKLNWDFLNPAVSCVRWFLGRFQDMLAMPVLLWPSLPAAIFGVIIVIALGVLLARKVSRSKSPPWLWGLAGFVLFALALVVVSALEIFAVNHMVLGVAVLVIGLQLIEGPLLLWPRGQIVTLCLFLVFHSYLAMIGFVDFQALALCLLFTFVPGAPLTAWQQERKIILGPWQLDRLTLYVLLMLGSGLLTAVHYRIVPLFLNIAALQGFAFNLGVLILIWPWLAGLLGQRDWRWQGVPVFQEAAPKALYAIPVLLLAFAMTSYLGLRTAGNFSMFSNLKTEGETSNHILLGSNPLKVWGYQEDVVVILDFPAAESHLSPHFNHLRGKQLPAVAFHRQVDDWRKRDLTVPITITYGGQTLTSDDITAEPAWQAKPWTWQAWLLDFRVIQPEGANLCRW